MPGEPSNPIWFAGTEVAILAMLCLVSWFWSTAKPLRGFILALFTIYVGHFFIIPYIYESITLSNWMHQASWGMRLVVFNLLLKHFVLILLMVLTLIGSGIGRKELFLVRGNPSALFKPIRFLPDVSDGPTSWKRVGRSFLIYFIIIGGIVLALQIRPSMSQLYKVFIFLPAIIIGAAINAFSEEFEYRSVLLARLVPVLGANSAILISSVFFGLMHYLGGTPSGPLGVILTGSLGFLMAKSMIETRGFIWAFLIHFTADILVFCGTAALI
jgi:membrane protease YdiL (CAAX protease family)